MNIWKRKFDSDIQKKRKPISKENKERFNQLHNEFLKLLIKIGSINENIFQDIEEKSQRPNLKVISINLDPSLKLGEESLKITDQMIKLLPDRAVPWTCRALALGSLFRFEEALLANEQAIEIDPSDPEKWELQSSILDSLERKVEAQEAREKAARLRSL